MLIIRRKAKDTITIVPFADIDPSLSVGELFEDGQIEITMLEISPKSVKVSISAPPSLKIWRGKVCRVEHPLLDIGNISVD